MQTHNRIALSLYVCCTHSRCILVQIQAKLVELYTYKLFFTKNDIICCCMHLQGRPLTYHKQLKISRYTKKLINMWPNFEKSTIILEFSSLTWYCLKQRMLFKYFLGSSTNFYLQWIQSTIGKNFKFSCCFLELMCQLCPDG